jgi:hypothetical protein
MRFRKLRIAWSVGCGIVAVLFCVLWVWSHFHPYLEHFYSSTNWRLGILNGEGWVAFNLVREDGSGEPSGMIEGPHWLMIFLAVVAAPVPWLLSNRFSLRTLLIATTLIAVVLGLIVWLAT